MWTKTSAVAAGDDAAYVAGTASRRSGDERQQPFRRGADRQIVDEFVAAIRRGQRPSVEEFARRYPEQADDSCAIMPAMTLMKALTTVRSAASGHHHAAGEATGGLPGSERVGPRRQEPRVI
jgi:hypothetical protein